MTIYVLIDTKTGDFWRKRSNGRHVNAYTSVAKAKATIKMFHPRPAEGEIEIKRFENNETQPDSTRGSDR